MWRKQELQFHPMSQDLIRQSCIRINPAVAGAPYIAFPAGPVGRGALAITVFMGRYLSCWDDPYVVGLYLCTRTDPPLFPNPVPAVPNPQLAAIELSIKYRIKQMLFNNAGPAVANITLDWESVGNVLPMCTSRQDRNNLHDLCRTFRIELVNNIQLLPQPMLIPGPDQARIIKGLLNIWNPKMEGKHFKDALPHFSAQCILNHLGGANSQMDLFLSLERSLLVDFYGSGSDAISARHGPGDLEIDRGFLNFSALTDRMIKSELEAVDELWSDFLIGTTDIGQSLTAERQIIGGLFYTNK
jgi:hypothetical protein